MRSRLAVLIKGHITTIRLSCHRATCQRGVGLNADLLALRSKNIQHFAGRVATQPSDDVVRSNDRDIMHLIVGAVHSQFLNTSAGDTARTPIDNLHLIRIQTHSTGRSDMQGRQGFQKSMQRDFDGFHECYLRAYSAVAVEDFPALGVRTNRKAHVSPRDKHLIKLRAATSASPRVSINCLLLKRPDNRPWSMSLRSLERRANG